MTTGARSLRCLVVDDEPDNADLLHALLERRGHRVQLAEDGPSALRALEGGAPDVLLLDLNLPGMDGFEVAKAVRERFGKGVPIVAVTGLGDAEHRARAHRAGCNAILIKPFSIEDLDQLIAAIGGKEISRPR